MEIRAKSKKWFMLSITESCYITINRGQIWNFKPDSSGDIWLHRKGVHVCINIETFNKYFETIIEEE